MPEDLPIYSDSTLRTRLQFADLDRLRGRDSSTVWERADGYIAQMEGADNVAEARAFIKDPTKAALLSIHGILFRSREGAGRLRRVGIPPIYRGQDCPEPEFIDRSLNNFCSWLDAESLAEIHPLEKAALVLTRIVDIWPFEFGNLTTAVIFANVILGQAGFSPFFVKPGHLKEFNTVIAKAMTIETQPLVSAIHQTIKREMESLGPRQ